MDGITRRCSESTYYSSVSVFTSFIKLTDRNILPNIAIQILRIFTLPWFQIVQLSLSSFPDYFARCMASLLTIFVSNPEFTRIITLITFFFPEKSLLQLIVCCLTCQSILRKENHQISLTFLLQKIAISNHLSCCWFGAFF